MLDHPLATQNRLLIVDDDLALRARLARIMTKKGFEVAATDSLAPNPISITSPSF